MRLTSKIIGFLYKNILKKIFFLFDPERIHDLLTSSGVLLGRFSFTRFITSKFFEYKNPVLTQNILGIEFSNPIGLSAGFDKDASLMNILPKVGFGYEEVGSITLEPYIGNPKPRLFRLKKSKALVVYYGLKNIGVGRIIPKLKMFDSSKFPLGISIAKTNCDRTAETHAGVQDYYDCLDRVIKAGVGDFYEINISCPNTFGGEPFTTPERLELLLSKLRKLHPIKPMFIKMPINLEWKDFNELLQVAVKYKVKGVVIGNLTKVRDPNLIKDEIPEGIKGGISGRPTWDLSNNLISQTYTNYGNKLTIIGVGGVFSAEDAYEKIKRGSSLVSLITGMIFMGPQLIGEINYGLSELLKKDGYTNISEAIGAYHR